MATFDLPAGIFDEVHKLRGKSDGIQILKDTGRFREYMVKRTGRKREAPFIGWDGEGWTDNDGEHRYMYFANSLGYFVEYPVLSTIGCLDLILGTGAKYPYANHVIYGGGYDVTHILRDVPDELRMLLYRDGTMEWEQYRFQYIPHKWFTVTGIPNVSLDRDLKPKMTTVKMWDLMTFFQSSFIAALESRGIHVPDEIVQGKKNRAQFGLGDLETIKVYTGLELEFLVQLANQIRSEFIEAGLPLSHWHGPGAVANVVMAKYGIEHHMAKPEPHIEALAAEAYFGGRFECFQAGHHNGKVYQYDICSAYPDKIRNLPSLAGAAWRHVSIFDSNAIGIWRCRYNGGDATAPHPIPWRGSHGEVGFPQTVDIVSLWTWEAVNATEVIDGWILDLATDERPFAFIDGMYVKRAEWKLAGKGGQHALKLAMNSVYGKTAQRVGGKNGEAPKWHQLIWAGMITSQTRAQLWPVIQQNPTAIISTETDSITSLVPLALPLGKALGDWEAKEFGWITYFQSGVYFYEHQHDKDCQDGCATLADIKSRGFDPSSVSHGDILTYLSGSMDEPLLAQTRRFIALGNPRQGHYGQWLDEARDLSISAGKRIHLPENCQACADGLNFAQSLHTMSTHPAMGLCPSKAHPLPWSDVEANSPEFYDRSELIDQWEGAS